MKLWEQYRPAKMEEIVGHDKAKRVIARLAKRGLGGSAFWISGAPGTGKNNMRMVLDRVECGEMVTTT